MMHNYKFKNLISYKHKSKYIDNQIIKIKLGGEDIMFIITKKIPVEEDILLVTSFYSSTVNTSVTILNQGTQTAISID